MNYYSRVKEKVKAFDKKTGLSEIAKDVRKVRSPIVVRKQKVTKQFGKNKPTKKYKKEVTYTIRKQGREIVVKENRKRKKDTQKKQRHWITNI